MSGSKKKRKKRNMLVFGLITCIPSIKELRVKMNKKNEKTKIKV